MPGSFCSVTTFPLGKVWRGHNGASAETERLATLELALDDLSPALNLSIVGHDLNILGLRPEINHGLALARIDFTIGMDGEVAGGAFCRLELDLTLPEELGCVTVPRPVAFPIVEE